MLIDSNTAVEVGLLIRAVMYALLFLGMGVVVWNAGESVFGQTKQWTTKAFAILCFAIGLVNIFMAFEWFIMYFWG